MTDMVGGVWVWALGAAQPDPPAPAPGSGLDTSSTAITAGLGGFFVLFGLGLVLWFIARDMSKRIRRINQREELRVRQEDETRAAEDGASSALAGGAESVDPRLSESGLSESGLPERDPLA